MNKVSSINTAVISLKSISKFVIRAVDVICAVVIYVLLFVRSVRSVYCVPCCLLQALLMNEHRVELLHLYTLHQSDVSHVSYYL